MNEPKDPPQQDETKDENTYIIEKKMPTSNEKVIIKNMLEEKIIKILNSTSFSVRF